MTSSKTKAVKEKTTTKKTVAKQKSQVVKEMLEPVVVRGSHLTVTTWPNGRTELKWDDDALLRDVQQAILKYESNIPAATEIKPKRGSKKARQ